MELATKYLDILKKEEILADFFADNYEESHYGFLLDYNDYFLLIENFDDGFNYEGIIIFLRHNISRIRWSGNDIESASKLIDNSKRQKDKIKIDLTSIKTILESVNKAFNIISVHIQDIDNSVCFIGQIHEIDDNFLVLHEFGTTSSLDRKFILLKLQDITRIDAGGQYESKLRRLFNE